MVSINEELKAAKAAKAAINVLLTTTPKSAVVATLNKANHAAILNLSSGGPLNEARGNVGIALSNLLHGPPTFRRQTVLRMIHDDSSACAAWAAQ